MAKSISILGYTKFAGVNGIFTIPVLRLTEFSVSTQTYSFEIPSIYSQITRVEFADIYNLVTDPPISENKDPVLINPFSSGSNVQFVPFTHR